MKAIILISTIAALLGAIDARAAKEDDQCEVTYIQAYMDEECE